MLELFCIAVYMTEAQNWYHEIERVAGSIEALQTKGAVILGFCALAHRSRPIIPFKGL